MAKFYVTFGQQYRYVNHPKSLNIHPDGYMVIEADSYELARIETHKLLGNNFAFLYPESEFKPTYFPRGEIVL